MQPKANLDMLRSIAVLLVVVDHFLLARGHGSFYILHQTWASAWLGYFGVYLFFVHTSLVLMWSLQRRPHTLDFYIRRVFRIYPLAIVAILSVLLLHLPLATDGTHLFTPYRPSLIGVLSNLLLVQNISHGGGYALAVMWSLPLEVQMYVLLPVLYFFIRKNFSLWPLLLLWALACGLAYHDVWQGNTFATVVPCFLPGVMAYVLFSKIEPVLPAWLFPVYVVLLCIGFMHFSTPVAGWFACLALALALPFFHQVQLSLLKRATYELAKHSYSIYLSHVFALVICFYLYPLRGLSLKLLGSVALTAVFSVVGYRLVEAPMVRLGARVAARAEARYERYLSTP